MCSLEAFRRRLKLQMINLLGVITKSKSFTHLLNIIL